MSAWVVVSPATKLQHADHVKPTILYDALYPVESIGSLQVRVVFGWHRPSFVRLQRRIRQLGGLPQAIR